tara:strand:+ start:33 stop:455 length:423 start_codon:yes stop_codon:yes gene_type:complete
MYEYKCTIDRVVDGDTVDAIINLGFSVMFKSRVRLYGIDTPESRTRNKDEKALGLLSKDFLKNKIESGNEIVLRTKLRDSRGKFGRVLAVVVVDGEDINQLMIDNFYGAAYFGQSKDEIKEEHISNRQILIDLGIHTPVE